MSEIYRPAAGAEPQSSYNTVLLSHRDLSLNVPINFVTTPGVSLSAACFSNGRFEDDSAAICLSNLLAVGFRRFVLDLYWDQERKLWSFCPAIISTSTTSPVSSPTSTTSPGSSSLALLSARQTSLPTVTVGTSLSGSSLGQANPTIAVLPNSSDTPLTRIGPYSCTTTINLSTFTSLLLDYIQKTENTLGAHLLYIILNIHAASSAGTSTASAPVSSNLPGSSDSLGSLFSTNLSAFIYTPSNLRTDRANVNASWYTVQELYRPAEDYYTVVLNGNDIASTESGWPSESYIEFSKSKRVLLGFGTVDSQMAGYNFTDDSATVFENGYIQLIERNINATSSGRVTSGCFLRNDTELLGQTNSSWAVDNTLADFDYPTTESSDLTPLLNLTLNTTQCGVTSILNTTLLNVTANVNYRPYQEYSLSTIWSWATNEPRNYTPSDASSSTLFRCATVNPDLSFRWVVADCSQHYYAACRAYLQPYNWTITTYPISYSYADEACPSGYQFAAPRTALENSYLGQAMRNLKRDYDGHGAWVDFNSLNIEGCWTTGGPNATCPYSDSVAQMNDLQKRVILVPTVAAIIVLIITALTLFVKVAGNRRVRKRTKKRADNGFVYEGVPS